MQIKKKIWDICNGIFFNTIVDKFVVWKNKSVRKDVEPVFDLPSHVVKINRLLWDNYDWSRGGDEWTQDVKTHRGIDPSQWKTSLINNMMLKYVKDDSTILEVGIGAGRWTEILQPLAKKLILVDISEKCIEICKNKFKNSSNVEYYLINGRLNMIKDNSIDYVWSYDVFVHINPTDIEKYIEDFSLILKPGGYAIIHHSGKYSEQKIRVNGFRSYMNAARI